MQRADMAPGDTSPVLFRHLAGDAHHKRVTREFGQGDSLRADIVMADYIECRGDVKAYDVSFSGEFCSKTSIQLLPRGLPLDVGSKQLSLSSDAYIVCDGKVKPFDLCSEEEVYIDGGIYLLPRNQPLDVGPKQQPHNSDAEERCPQGSKAFDLQTDGGEEDYDFIKTPTTSASEAPDLSRPVSPALGEEMTFLAINSSHSAGIKLPEYRVTKFSHSIPPLPPPPTQFHTESTTGDPSTTSANVNDPPPSYHPPSNGVDQHQHEMTPPQTRGIVLGEGNFHATSFASSLTHFHSPDTNTNNCALRATCLRSDGTLNTSSINLDDLLRNTNGRFEWISPTKNGGEDLAPSNLPAGCFSHSTRNIRDIRLASDFTDVLEAELGDGVGGWNLSRVCLGERIENREGVLVYLEQTENE